MDLRFDQLNLFPKFFCDYLYEFSKVAKFYNGDFRDDKTFLNVLSQIDKKDFPRKKLIDILQRQNQSLGCSELAFKNIKLFEEKESYAVFTGQQVGILGGPLYTFYKAISVIKLAHVLTRKYNRNFVPVFWLASEDHDFIEVNHLHIIDKENRLKKIEYLPEDFKFGKSMSQVFLDSSFEKLFSQLDNSFSQTEFKEEVLSRLKGFYAPNENFSLALAKMLSFLFSKYGLVILEPQDKEVKELSKEIFLKEIENFGKVNQSFEQATQELKKLNYKPQIHKDPSYLNFFLDTGKREKIRIEEKKFVLESGEKISLEELGRIIVEEPERITPNVILRPIVQGFVFPTAVYLAGPGEISYYAQIKTSFDFFSVPMPIIYPRASLTLIEDKIDKVLEKYSLSLEELSKDAELVINKILQKSFPQEMGQKFTELRQNVLQELERKKKNFKGLDEDLAKNFEQTKGKIEYELNLLEKKVFQSYRQKNQIMREQLLKAKDSLFPDNQPQERVLSLVYFLMKYGWKIVDFIYASTEIENYHHQVLKIKSL
jgi:bacillithiol biosynthesis cysteine-adding enzyme BshC